MDAGPLIRVKALTTPCAAWSGIAASPELGVLVTSCRPEGSLLVYALPCDARAQRRPFRLLHTLEFGFRFGYATFIERSGLLAFTKPAAGEMPLLLATDPVQGRVHVVDVGARKVVGCIATPKLRKGMDGIATTRGLVAVARRDDDGDGSLCGFRVFVFAGGGAEWRVVNTIYEAGRYCLPMRFSADGSDLAVFEGRDEVSGLKLHPMSNAAHTRTRRVQGADDQDHGDEWWRGCCKDICDFEDCGGEWWAASYGFSRPCRLVQGYRSRPKDTNGSDSQVLYLAMTFVPGLGIVAVRTRRASRGDISVFCTRDMRAMALMSAARVAWMQVAARCVLHRSAATDVNPETQASRVQEPTSPVGTAPERVP